MLTLPGKIEIGISIGLFIVAWMTLGKGVFEPMLDLLAERDRRTVGFQKQALVRKDEARQVARRVEEGLHAARVSAMQKREQAVREAKADAQSKTDRAAKEAQERLDSSRTALESLKSSVRKDLAGEAEGLSSVFVEKATVITDTRSMAPLGAQVH